MKRLTTTMLVLAILLLSGCASGARTLPEMLHAVKPGMSKDQVYELVDVQYFRDNDSFLGVIISEIVATRASKLLDFTIGDTYHHSYYGYFFFNATINSNPVLFVIGWDDNSIVAIGLIPFARAQEIAEDKYGQPFRR